ncbi:hypothetical protein [Mesorhizobium sp. KR2-14]|uniref:hypothetical protein n=1 Tax=Mesorhizobium sp. KR2-14 TaxID=3156610 RepID=UPI0032B3CE5D
MVFLALWIICAGVTVVISSSKGYNAFIWFLIGILLGPVALLLSIFLPFSKNSQNIGKGMR